MNSIQCVLSRIRQRPFSFFVGLAVLLRLFFLYAYSKTPYFYSFPDGLDSSRFDEFAQIIASGDFLFQKGVYPQSPLYSYFLAFWYLIIGFEARFWGIRLIQSFLGVLTGIFLFFSAKELWDERTAKWVFFFYLLCPLFLYYEVQFLRVTLTLFLTISCFLCWLYWRKTPTAKAGIRLGLVVGFLFLQEPNYLLIVPFLLCEKKLPFKKLVGYPLFAFLLVLSLLVFRNLALDVSPLSISAQGPGVFVAGHAPDALGIGWFTPPSTAKLKEAGSLPKVMVASIAANRGDWLNYFRLQIRKFMALLADFEIPNNSHFAFDRSYWLPSLFLFFPTYGFFMGFGVLGLFLRGWKEKKFQPLGGFFLGAVFSVMAFYILSRFRMVLLLPLLLGTAYFFSLWKALIWKKIWFLGGIVLLVFSCGYTPPDARMAYGYANLARAYLLQAEREGENRESFLAKSENLFIQAIQTIKSEFEKAPEWYRELVSMRPVRYSYLRQLAEVKAIRGNFKEAEDVLKEVEKKKQSRKTKQSWAFLYLQKGVASFQKRQWSQSIKELQRSFQYSPSKETALVLIKVIEVVYQKQPHFSLLYNQAVLHKYLKQFRQTEQLLLKCLEQNIPNSYRERIQQELESLRK